MNFPNYIGLVSGSWYINANLILSHDMRYLLGLFFVFLTACGSSVPTLKPYKMDIQQGNVVNSKMLLQLRPGMTKSQVRYIMGTPLIADSFHTNRWDYFFQLRQKGDVVEQRRVILDFENEKLARVRGDVVPQGSDKAQVASSEDRNKVITVAPKAKEEKSWVDKLKFWKSDEESQQKNVPIKQTENVEAVAASASEKRIEKAVEKTPIEMVPEQAVKAVEAVEVNTPIVGDPTEMAVKPITFPTVKEEPNATQTLQTPEVTEKPTIVPVQAVPTKPVVKVESVEPAKVTPVTIESTVQSKTKLPPTLPAQTEGDWRFERTLRSMIPEVEVEPIKQSVNKVAPTPPPPMEEDVAPGYFERILEKIGF